MTKRLRWEIIVLVCMYLGYMGFMTCRNTIIVASPAMIADETLGMDKGSYGKLMAYHSAGGVVGKALSGFAVDRWGGRLVFLLLLGATAATTAGFGLVSKFGVQVGLNFTGQATKSGGWPAMAAIIRSWYSPGSHGRVWGIISTSSRVGVMTATLLLGQLLAWGVQWRSLFFFSAGLATAITVLGFFLLKSGPEKVGLAPPTVNEDTKEQPAHDLDGQTTAEAALAFLYSPRVWLISISMALTTVLMDFLTFIPLYLAESLKLEAGAAGKAATAFPAGCFVAVLAAGFVYDKLSKKQRVFAIGGLLLSGIASLLVLWALPSFGVDQGQGYMISMAAIFLFGVAVAPAYYLPMSVFAISFGGPFCGFLICLFDMFGYAGAFVFNYFGGSLADIYGWDAFLMTLIGLTLAAFVTVSAFLALDAKRSPKVLPSPYPEGSEPD